MSPGVCPSERCSVYASPSTAERLPSSTTSRRPEASSRGCSAGMYDARSRACGWHARSHAARPTTKRALGKSSVGASPARHGESRPPAWSKCRWESTTTSMAVCGASRAVRWSSRVWPSSSTPKRARMAGSKKAPMPVSKSTRRPEASTTSIERHARGMRCWSSGAIQRDHRGRGTLPNIAPPSRRCRLPSTDQSVRAIRGMMAAPPRGLQPRTTGGLAQRLPLPWVRLMAPARRPNLPQTSGRRSTRGGPPPRATTRE
jgi:hypothetical protein